MYDSPSLVPYSATHPSPLGGHRLPQDGFNGHWLAGLIRDLIVVEVVTYEECVTQRVLRSFDQLGDEANEKANALMASVSLQGEDPDYEGAAQWAGDEAYTWASNVSAIYWGTSALLTAGLFHLFEQQVAFLFRRLRRASWHEDYGKGEQISVKDFVDWLAANGVAIAAFHQWKKVNVELRALANVVKHAEGGAANTLRELRPDLFTIPGSGIALMGAIDRPIGGGGVFVSEDEFKSYAAAVRAFWSWLADEVEGA